jgi:hypothetical protein
VFDDTYVNMELAIPRDGDGPEFAKVTKRLRDKNGFYQSARPTTTRC